MGCTHPLNVASHHNHGVAPHVNEEGMIVLRWEGNQHHFINLFKGVSDNHEHPDGIRMSLRFGLYWGLGGCVFLLIAGPLVGPVFSDDPKVQADLMTYFQIIPIGYGFLAVASVASSAFNAVDRAVRSTSPIFRRKNRYSVHCWPHVVPCAASAAHQSHRR